MKRICVFCGAATPANPAYLAAANELGVALANQGVGLVYGGAKIGLMGAVADGCLSAKGEVIGVIPKQLLERELAHTGITQLHVVQTMHQRKALMAEYADGFIALPGGFGTLDEFAEILTWAQLGLHTKPCGLLNVENYWDNLIKMFDHAFKEGLLSSENRQLVLVDAKIDLLLLKMQDQHQVATKRWLTDLKDV
jgi:uncharacterized protein (TIGR00730 family)